MKSIILIALTLFCYSASAQTKISQDSVSTLLVRAGGMGVAGVILTSTAPAWIGIQQGAQLNPTMCYIIGGAQIVAGVILQVWAWNMVRQAGLRAGGRTKEMIRPNNATLPAGQVY